MHRPAPVPTLDPGRVLTKAVFSAAELLQLRSRELAETIGISEATLSRLRGGKAIEPDSKQGELALLFLRLFRSLDALMGGNETKARAWLRAENLHLGGVPVQRMRRVEGLVDVVQYLDAMRGRL